MARWGFWVLLFGVLYFVLPYFGMQHVLFAFLGEAATAVAVGFCVVGAGLIVAGLVRRKAAPVEPKP